MRASKSLIAAGLLLAGGAGPGWAQALAEAQTQVVLGFLAKNDPAG